jgi:hypothetical protein
MSSLEDEVKNIARSPAPDRATGRETCCVLELFSAPSCKQRSHCDKSITAAHAYPPVASQCPADLYQRNALGQVQHSSLKQSGRPLTYHSNTRSILPKDRCASITKSQNSSAPVLERVKKLPRPPGCRLMACLRRRFDHLHADCLPDTHWPTILFFYPPPSDALT